MTKCCAILRQGSRSLVLQEMILARFVIIAELLAEIGVHPDEFVFQGILVLCTSVDIEVRL